MNTKRLVVLGFALVAASAAALLVRGMMGGGTPKLEAKIAPAVVMSQVLVASASLQPGQALTAEQVRWENWPAKLVDSTFITHDTAPNIEDAVKGTVVRVPLVSGQPITNTEIVHANAAGFMAAMLNPGMRAVSITITTDSGAGGFILPNDRIDLIMTQKLPGEGMHVRVRTILQNVRVLAVDQTFKQEKDAKTVIGKTATLELTPIQTEQVARAQGQGALSLSLRPLSDDPSTIAANVPVPPSGRTSSVNGSAATASGDDSADGDGVAIIRYGVSRPSSPNEPGKVQ